MSNMSAKQEEMREGLVEDIVITTEDGARLSGCHFKPDGDAELCLIINGATGVPCSFYLPFAAWVCQEKQAHVIVYDYRDFGRSSTGSLVHSKATMSDWGVTDQGAVLKHVVEHYGDLPIWVLGHSLGGLGLMFQEDNDKVERLIAVASGPANLFRHPPHFIPAAMAFWFAIGPVSTFWSGYLPGRQIGFGADLPSGVYWQWRKWCIMPDFHKSEWGKELPQPDLDRFKGELKLVGAKDDTSVPVSVVADLAQFYPSAKVLPQVTLRPSDFNLRSIGHLHSLSEKCKATWSKIVD